MVSIRCTLYDICCRLFFCCSLFVVCCLFVVDGCVCGLLLLYVDCYNLICVVCCVFVVSCALFVVRYSLFVVWCLSYNVC